MEDRWLILPDPFDRRLDATTLSEQLQGSGMTVQDGRDLVIHLRASMRTARDHVESSLQVVADSRSLLERLRSDKNPAR